MKKGDRVICIKNYSHIHENWRIDIPQVWLFHKNNMYEINSVDKYNNVRVNFNNKNNWIVFINEDFMNYFIDLKLHRKQKLDKISNGI